MLSIGKVGGGQASPSYYVEHVAQGAEDYYTGAGEARGRWHGKGAAARGLTGSVDDDEFLTLLSADSAPGKTVLGYDLTFSAPKSVSILFGIGDRELSRQVRDAHDEAVRQALDYVERHACWTRRGRAGRTRIPGDGLAIATFRHRTSRAGDPQLHTHAVVANATLADAKVTALDGQALYAHARTAGYLYQAVLRDQLTRTVGLDWQPVHHGTAEIRDINDGILRHFSRRTQDIEEHLKRRGVRSMKAARVVKLATRKAKTYDVPAGRLREEWRSRASEMGLGEEELRSLLDRRAPGRPRVPDRAAVASDLDAPGGVTRESSTFDRRDVLRDLAEAHGEGAAVTELEALADAWLASAHAVRLERGHWRQHLGGARYSTVSMLQLESRLMSDAAARRDTGVAVAREGAVEASLASPLPLSDEQVHLVREATTSGDGVQVVRAAAGTGKTHALAVARDAWESSGIRVYGCALAARAALEIETLAGIDSTTIARLLQDIDRGYGLERGSVLVVDEAGMVGSRAIARLADHAAETDSKLLLVGDDRQLPELDAGGAFRGLAERLGAVELHEVRRQVEAWDREALTALRRGRVTDWSEAYRDHGRLVARPSATAVRESLVDDWWEAARRHDQDVVMIAHRRVDVAELNVLARERMHRDGRLSEHELHAGGRAFALGDRVIARRNDRRAGIVNGTRGEVVDVDLERRCVRIATGPDQVQELEAGYLDDGWLEHGYALTAHAAQGATVDRAFVLGSDELYREWGYTALSRHRAEAKFYVVSPGSAERALPGVEPVPDPLVEDISAMLGQSRRKTLATELLEREGRHVPAAAERGADDRQDARRRIDELSEEREALGFWQRSQRREVDELIAMQREALERWSTSAEALAEIPTPRAETRTVPSVDAGVVRMALIDPSPEMIRTLGPRPAGFRDRDAWCRAAARLAGGEIPAYDPTDAPLTMDDNGLEL